MARLESNSSKSFQLNTNEESPGVKFDLHQRGKKPAVDGAQPQEMRQQAISEFDRETENESSSPAAVPQEQDYLSNAQLLMQSGEYDLAIKLLVATLDRLPDDEWALDSLAECHRAQANFSEARLLSQRCFDLYPNFHSAVAVAHSCYALNDDDAATNYYQRALTYEHSEQHLFEVLKNLGNMSVRRGELESAEEYYNKAYTLNPDSDVLLVNYGTLEIQREDFESARDRFRQAVEINLSNERAWVGLALVHRYSGDLELSWANTEKALDIDAGNDTAIKLLVDWAFKDNRLSDGIRYLESYLNDQSEEHSLRIILAQLLCSLERFKHAKFHVEFLCKKSIQIEGLDELVALLAGVE